MSNGFHCNKQAHLQQLLAQRLRMGCVSIFSDFLSYFKTLYAAKIVQEEADVNTRNGNTIIHPTAIVE